jgi:hypothetical protein
MINLFLDAEVERVRLGMNPLDENSQYVLSLNNERMRNHIKGKYGGRMHGKENKL